MEKTNVTFEIGNLSEKPTTITTPRFVNSGYEWYVAVQSCSSAIKDYLGVSMHLANPESLRYGWRMRVHYHIIMWNQSGEELTKTSEVCSSLSAKSLSLGFNVLDQEKGFLQKNQLIIKVKVNLVEVVYEKKKWFAFFKLDWLKEKLFERKKKSVAHQVVQLQDQCLKNFKVEVDKSCLEQIVSDNNKVELDKERPVKFTICCVV